RQKCIYRKQYDPLFFVELKQEILKREKRVHSIDTFCNVYKRDNPDKVAPSTKTVYKMIHRGQIEGIKPYMLPRMIKLKPRRKTDGQCNTKKNKKILDTSIEQRPEHINSREEKGHFEIDAVKGKNGKEKKIPKIQKILNKRCRKILNYRSAEEYHFDNTTA
ncbi:hypothetical protein HMPREF1552_01015, partial [Leptotrichia sp. oral taxon 879 str. F0557]